MVVGEDGRTRCGWGASPAVYTAYHDTEWGRPERDDDRLFEKVCLEGFQAGLSWLTILNKREAFRAAFAGFSIAVVAEFGAGDVARLVADAGIVRNRAKIEAAISNAVAVQELQATEGSFHEFVWSFRPATHPPLLSLADSRASTPESEALSKELKRRGFRFVGPTTMYALMQAMGLVNDHLVDCWVYDEVEAAQRAV